MKNPTILCVNNGFYFFGDLLKEAPEGYIAMDKVSMSGGFEGGKGIFGVARGDSAAKIKLDRLEPTSMALWPIGAVCGIFPSIDLYQFKGTTIR